MASSRSTTQKPAGNFGRTLLVAVGLMILTWLVFGRTLQFDFVNYDDRVYVLQNQQVRAGLTWPGVAAAFSHEHAGNWHPLTTLTHMADCQWWGLDPGGHHFGNVLLHSCAVVLLFLALFRMTGSFWPSAFVAAVFAIHPLRAESVVWVAERKDVLSALFFMLTLMAYARYARAPSVTRYLLVAATLVAGLLSKPMLVTCPVVLLLLDYWPLGRAKDGQRWVRLIGEKIPLLLLAAPTSIATFVIQKRSSGSIAPLPFHWRVENAVVTCVTYVGELFWPVDLTVFYTHPENRLTMWQIGGAALVIVGVTAIAWGVRKTRPYFLTGWLWYLVMLGPVIGIVQVGLQGHADRYTYLPHIGLCIALAWLIADALRARKFAPMAPALAATVLIGLLALLAWHQAGFWKNSETLWRHALAVTRDNDVAETNLGMVLAEGDHVDEGIEHLQRALAIRGDSNDPHYRLSLSLIHCDLGFALARKGEVEEAERHLRESVALQPNYPDAHYNLATVLLQEGQLDEAIAEYGKIIELRPDDAGAHTSLGNALAQRGRVEDAMTQYEEALRVAPDSILALNNLAWILSASPDPKIRNGNRAVELANKAVELSGGNNLLFLRTLAAAYAEAGRFPEALSTAQRALHIAEADTNEGGVRTLEEDVTQLKSGMALRDESLAR